MNLAAIRPEKEPEAPISSRRRFPIALTAHVFIAAAAGGAFLGTLDVWWSEPFLALLIGYAGGAAIFAALDSERPARSPTLMWGVATMLCGLRLAFLDRYNAPDPFTTVAVATVLQAVALLWLLRGAWSDGIIRRGAALIALAASAVPLGLALALRAPESDLAMEALVAFNLFALPLAAWAARAAKRRPG